MAANRTRGPEFRKATGADMRAAVQRRLARRTASNNPHMFKHARKLKASSMRTQDNKQGRKA